MDKPLQLVAPFSPAGDQPNAIRQLVSGLRDGEAGPPPPGAARALCGRLRRC